MSQMSKMQNASIFFHFFPFFISLISYAFCRKLFYIENVISYAKVTCVIQVTKI